MLESGHVDMVEDKVVAEVFSIELCPLQAFWVGELFVSALVADTLEADVVAPIPDLAKQCSGG